MTPRCKCKSCAAMDWKKDEDTYRCDYCGNQYEAYLRKTQTTMFTGGAWCAEFLKYTGMSGIIVRDPCRSLIMDTKFNIDK